MCIKTTQERKESKLLILSAFKESITKEKKRITKVDPFADQKFISLHTSLHGHSYTYIYIYIYGCMYGFPPITFS